MRAPARVDLVPGITFDRGAASYRLRSINISDEVMICELPNRNMVSLQLPKFYQEYMDGHIVNLRSEGRRINITEHNLPQLDALWEAASERDRDKAIFRWQLIRAVEEEGPVIFDAGGRLELQLRRLSEALGQSSPSRATFHRWYSAHLRDGGTADIQLRRRPTRGTDRTSRLQDDVDAIIREQLVTFSQGSFKRTQEEWTAVINANIREYNARNLPAEPLLEIHRSTWARRAKFLSPVDQIRGTIGKNAAAKAKRFVEKVDPPRYALQTVQADHTRLKIRLFDEGLQKLFSEVWLTALICVKTKVILAFAINPARHDSEVAMKCFEMMVLPKTNFKSWCPEAKNDWPCFGIPHRLITDNGKEFLSGGFTRFASSYGCAITWAPGHTPEWKASIERWFGTLKGKVISRLAGSTRRREDPDQPKKKEIIKDAYTMRELTVLVGIWIVDYYHTDPHRGIGISPIQAWERESPSIYIALPQSMDHLLARSGKIVWRTLNCYGVEFEGERFAGSEIRQLFERKGPSANKVLITYAERHADRIYVLDDTDPHNPKYVIAWNTNNQCRSEYTREQWKEVRRESDARNLDCHTIHGASTAAAFVEMNNEALKNKRSTQRRVAQAARARGVGSDEVISNVSAARSNPVRSFDEDDLIDIPDLKVLGT